MLHFEIRKCESSNFVLRLQDCFDYLGFFRFHMNFRMSFSIAAKKALGVLIGDCLSISLSSVAIVFWGSINNIVF